MKQFILFTTFLYTLTLSPYTVFGYDPSTNQSSCPFTLFHLIKEMDESFLDSLGRRSPNYNSFMFLLEYGADTNPNLEEECDDPYYQRLPQGSTLLHVLAHAGIELHPKITLYRALVRYGANTSEEDANGDRVIDLSPCMVRQYRDPDPDSAKVIACGEIQNYYEALRRQRAEEERAKEEEERRRRNSHPHL